MASPNPQRHATSGIGRSVAGALGMPPFIATLGMMVVSGGVLWWTRSKNVAGLPESFVSLLAREWLGVPSAAWVVVPLAVAAWTGEVGPRLVRGHP